MLPDETPTDYTLVHTCDNCESKLRLTAYPVDGGWVAACVCNCRGKGGLPLRYSTDSDVLPTFDAAEKEAGRLLSQQPTDGYHNLKHISPNNYGYRVRFCRNGQNINIGNFSTIEDAIKVRDAFLEEAA